MIVSIKLKGQYTDVKSGCVTSVVPSLTPHSRSLIQKSRATVPLNLYNVVVQCAYVLYMYMYITKCTLHNAHVYATICTYEIVYSAVY